MWMICDPNNLLSGELKNVDKDLIMEVEYSEIKLDV